MIFEARETVSGYSIYVSLNGGKHWAFYQSGFPTFDAANAEADELNAAVQQPKGVSNDNHP